MACVVLHSFVPEKGGCKFEDAMPVTGLEDVPDGHSILGGLTAHSVRNRVAIIF